MIRISPSSRLIPFVPLKKIKLAAAGLIEFDRRNRSSLAGMKLGRYQAAQGIADIAATALSGGRGRTTMGENSYGICPLGRDGPDAPCFIVVSFGTSYLRGER